MKASELRIGNYVFDDEGILSKINGMQPYGYSIRCDEEEGCELLIDLYPQDGTIKKGFAVDINLCNPIPLTEEWLIKLGFIRKYSNYIIKAGDYYNSIKKECENGKWIYSYDESDAGCYELKEIKYVHQLQNLYFALTGKELTIKK